MYVIVLLLFFVIFCIYFARFFCCYRKIAISDKLLIFIPFLWFWFCKKSGVLVLKNLQDLGLVGDGVNYITGDVYIGVRLILKLPFSVEVFLILYIFENNIFIIHGQ